MERVWAILFVPRGAPSGDVEIISIHKILRNAEAKITELVESGDYERADLFLQQYKLEF